ncbi:MAG TPA: Nif3-like dinuclear metal center hexameric protein, partial [Candidatus Ozemobacteraceae bacterium]|nr:Nif3-like dinuclear metal center hexameric protein [Candidatus Ozemobacteraceae bacterium]
MTHVSRSTLLAFLEETFKTSVTPDVSYNGLQFEGSQNIASIVTGVDASCEFFRQAARRKADFAIVHHGLFWKGGEWKRITRFEKEKMELLLKGNFSLYALHLPLDSHPDLGNNAVMAQLLGLENLEPFSEYQGQKIGIKGRFPRPISRAQLQTR